MLTIHNFARGARGLRAIWLAEEMGLDYVVLNHSYPVDSYYRALNPLGTVPLLEADHGIKLTESIAMLLYIAQTYGPTPLLTSDRPNLAKCLQLTVFGETELAGPMNPLLSAKFGAPAADKSNWSVRGLEQRIARNVNYVESLIGGSGYLVGHHLTLADISVSPALGMWHGALGKPLSEKLTAYQERMSARPAFKRARVRCDTGSGRS